MMKFKKRRVVALLVSIFFILNIIYDGILRNTSDSMRSFAAATDYSVGFKWDVSELVAPPAGGTATESGNTTTVKTEGGEVVREVTLSSDKADLILNEYEDENPVLKTTFSFNLKKRVDPGNMEFTISGLDALIRNGKLTLNMNDPNLVKSWKIEKVEGKDQYKFTNLESVSSNNETTFTWQFNSREAVNGSNITLETSCTVKEIETDPNTGEVIKTTPISLNTNPVTFHYQSVPDENEVKIVCEDLEKLIVNNLNQDYDWRSYRSTLGLKGLHEYEKENKVNPNTDDYDAHYIVQDKTEQEGSLHSRGIKTSDYFIEVDPGNFNKNDILIVNANGDRVQLETVEINGKTYYGFYDFINHKNHKPGESYTSVYRVGVKNDKISTSGNDYVKLTGHYLVTYEDEKEVHDYTDSAAHKLIKDDEQHVGSGSVFYKHNQYQVNRTYTATNGVRYYEHSKPMSPIDQLLYDSVFNDKTITYYLYADNIKQVTNESGAVVNYDLVYEDTAPSIRNLNPSYVDSSQVQHDLGYSERVLRPDEYDFTRVKVGKLVDGNTIGIESVDDEGNVTYKEPVGFHYDVYGISNDPGSDYYCTDADKAFVGKWHKIGEGNTVAASEVFLPDGIDEVRIVVRSLPIRATVSAELDVKYHLDEELYPHINIDNENAYAYVDENDHTKGKELKEDTNHGTNLKNEFKRTQYVGSYENPTASNYGDKAYSLSWLRESTTTIDSTTAIEEFKYHDAWSELTQEEKEHAGSFRPSDYYSTNITSKGTIQADSERALKHFAVASKLPEGVTPSEDWLEKFKQSLEFSGVIQGTNETIDAAYVLANNAVSIYYDSDKGLVVAEFNFDGYAIKGDSETSVKFTYPAEISLAKVKSSGSSQNQYVAETYVTVLDENVKLSAAKYKTLVEPEHNPFSDTKASKSEARTGITAMGSQKSNYSDKSVESFYNNWVFENTAEVDGNNTDHLDTATHRMTSEYTYELGFHRMATENEIVTDPLLIDIVEGFTESAWKGYVKSVSFKNRHYPALSGSDGYEPEVYYLLEESSSVVDSAEGAEYKKTNTDIMEAISNFQQYGNGNEVNVSVDQYENDLVKYRTIKGDVESGSNGWTKATKNSSGEWVINQENVYAVAVLYKGNYQVTGGYLELGAYLNMRAPALENDNTNTNNHRAAFNESHVFAEGIDKTGGHFPMYSVSNKTLVILRHSVELVKVSSRDGRRLTGATFSVFNSTNTDDLVKYYTFDKKRNKNQQFEMKDMEVDQGGSLILNLAPGIYYYKETKAPTGYISDDALYRFRVVSDSNAVYYYNVDLKTSGALNDEYFVINNDEYLKYKNSIYSGKSAVSSASVFHVYDADGNMMDRFREDSGKYIFDITEIDSPIEDLRCTNGDITIQNLPAGTYFFGKTQDDKDGYYFSVADNSSISLKVMRKSVIKDVTYNVYEMSGSEMSANDQRVRFTKNADGTYTVTNAASGTEEVTPTDTGRVNITGLDATKKYYFTIVSAPEGFKKPSRAVYTVPENANSVDLYAAEQLEYTGRIVVEDDPIETASAKFLKIDGTVGDNYGNPVNSADYNMYVIDEDGSENKLYFRYDGGQQRYMYMGLSGAAGYTDILKSSTTSDGTGMFEVTGLPYGTYFMKEQNPPAGYRLNETKKYFRVTATTIDVNGNVIFADDPTDKMKLPDQEVLSNIILTKKDFRKPTEQLKDAAYRLYRLQANTDDSVSDEDYLAAAKAAVAAAKGNTANAGFVKYWGAEYVEQQYTDITGSASFNDLPFGIYLLFEARPPIGYTWNNDADKWTIWSEKNKTKVQSQIIELSAATVSANSDTSLVTELDESGNEIFREQTNYYAFYSDHMDDRQTGSARLLKTSTDEKPLTDGNFTLYQVNFTNEEIVAYLERNGETVGTLTDEVKESALENMTSRDVDISKHIAADGKPVPGDTVIKQNLITSDDPTIGATETVSGLDWGTYYFYEVKAPSGYSRDTTPKFFDVNSDTVATTIEVSMTDEKIFGEIWMYKQAKEKISGTQDDHLKLFGAVFNLFTSENKKVESVPRLRMCGLSTSQSGVAANGRKEFLVKSIDIESPTEIKFGIVDDNGTETTAASEYTITVNYEITKDGKITNVTADDSFKGIYGEGYNANEVKADTRLAYYAVTADKAMVYDGSIAKYREITVEETGCITDRYITADGGGRLNIRGLDWGSYYFHETVPPEGYGLSEDVIFTVNSYNCDNQFIKCEDSPATAAIIIDKEIPNTDYFPAYGEPTFMFKIHELAEFSAEDTAGGKTPDYSKENTETNITTNYKLTGREYTLAIHMTGTKGSVMQSVPVGQYLIEELPVSRYTCDKIEVVDSEKTDVKVKSAAEDTTTSALIITNNNKYDINGKDAASPKQAFTAFCDLTGADSGFGETLVFRVKYHNVIEHYENFSHVSFANNRIPGQRYVTAFKPIYRLLIPDGSCTPNPGTPATYTYEIDLEDAISKGDFEAALAYNTGEVRDLTAAELNCIKFKSTGSGGFTNVEYTSDHKLRLTLNQDPASVAGQTYSFDVGYAEGGLSVYDTNNTSMVRGTLNLTFSEVQADSRKRLILKNDVSNRSWFGENAATGSTSIDVTFIKSAADGTVTTNPPSPEKLSVESGYQFVYWYLLGNDGRPVLDKNTNEVMQFKDYDAINKYIFGGELPAGAEFGEDDKYLENVDKINGFTFQAEVVENKLPRAKLMTGPVVHEYLDNIVNSSGNHSLITEVNYSSTPPWENGHTEYYVPQNSSFNLSSTQYIAISVTRPSSVSADGTITGYLSEDSEYPNVIYAWCEWENGKSTYAIRWYTDDPVGIMANENSADLFREMSSMKEVDVTKVMNTSLVTDTNYMFYMKNNTTALKNLDLTNWDLSKDTNMSYMFYGLKGLMSVSFDSSFEACKNTSYMFAQCPLLTDVNFSDKVRFDSLENANMMFDNAQRLGYNTDSNGNPTSYNKTKLTQLLKKMKLGNTQLFKSGLPDNNRRLIWTNTSGENITKRADQIIIFEGGDGKYYEIGGNSGSNDERCRLRLHE